MKIKTKIIGTGIGLPEKKLTNLELESVVDTSDEWIYTRTGIKERRISSKNGGEWPTDLAAKASLMAIENATQNFGFDKNSIDLIIFATTTPDFKLPNSSSVLQVKLGLSNQCACFDLAAACTGHVYGLSLADALIKSGQMKNILVVGSEMLSREVNWNDRTTCILFGDAAGAMILSANLQADDPSDFLSHVIKADGSGGVHFNQYMGGAVDPITKDNVESPNRYMFMAGKDMFKVAVRALSENALLALEKCGKTIHQIDWMVPHQANSRIIQATGERLGIDPSKVIINIDKYANTSAATIPLAFHEAVSDGRIKRGQSVLLDAFGAGVTSGASVLIY